MQTHVGRQLGVTVSSNQLSAGTGEPNKVQHLIPSSMHAMQYSDDAGALHNELVLVIGKKVYLFPNGEAFAASLRPATTWIENKVLAILDSAHAPLPAADAVEIVTEQIANAHSEASK